MFNRTDRIIDEHLGDPYQPVHSTREVNTVYERKVRNAKPSGEWQNKNTYTEEEFHDAMGKMYDLVTDKHATFNSSIHEGNFRTGEWSGPRSNYTQNVWSSFEDGLESSYTDGLQDCEEIDEICTPKMQGNRKLDLTILPVPEPMSWKPISTHLPVKTFATMNVEPVKYTSTYTVNVPRSNRPFTGEKRVHESRTLGQQPNLKKAKSVRAKSYVAKGHWKPEEDAQLLRIVQQTQREYPGKGLSWITIAKGVFGRSAKQCRERYTLNLDPNIKREKFTLEEDDVLLLAYARLGSKWSKIKMELPGRTENMVKTRFKSLSRTKRKRWIKHDYQTALSKALKEYPKISKACNLRKVLPERLFSMVCDVELQQKMDERREAMDLKN